MQMAIIGQLILTSCSIGIPFSKFENLMDEWIVVNVNSPLKTAYQVKEEGQMIVIYHRKS